MRRALSIASFVVGGLLLMLWVAPSWWQPSAAILGENYSLIGGRLIGSVDGTKRVWAVPIWPLILLFVVVGWFEWPRRRLRIRPGRCGICGYDLRASPERCPECGTAVGQAGRKEPQMHTDEHG